MANSFNLSSGAKIFGCDIQGNVTSGGAPFGTWSVDNNNQINVTDNAGNVTAIPVTWQFNTGNQLELHQAGALAFNFHGDASVVPDMATVLAAIQVAPDQNNTSFFFSINGDWSMDNNFNLLFTPTGGAQSSINGLLQDTDSSQFVYIFISQAPGSSTYEFDFTGMWQQTSSGVDVDFIYDKGNGATGQINLPAGLTMDPVKNILVYTYNKGTHTGNLELAGTVRVNSNFSITYVLDQQDAAGIQSTTFSIAAALNDPKGVGQGNLKLNVKRAGQDFTLEVGGNYHGTIAGLDLTVGFTYNRMVLGATITDTVAFNGTISNPKNDDQFTWQFMMNGQQIEVDLTAQIALSNQTCLNAALNFTVNGNQVGISAIFGISTNCGVAALVTAKPTMMSPLRRAIAARTK
jgi:hypothetical protein